MADLIPTDELKAYLVGLGIVQDIGAPLSVDLPGIWLNPRDEAPEPRRKSDVDIENVTVSIFDGPEIPREWLEGFLQEKVYDFVVRARTRPEGVLVQRKIRAAFEEKKGVMFGQLRVEWSKLFRGEQPVTSDQKTSYTSIQSFRIAYRTVSLTV